MEIKYLKSKKGSFSETISWAVATSIIFIMLLIYLFVISFARSELNSDIEYRKFLSNSFEREFYTFLDEKVLFEDKNISVKELSKKVQFRNERDSHAEKIPISAEEKILRVVSFNYMKKQGDLIDKEKTEKTMNIELKVEPFDLEKDSFYLLSSNILSLPLEDVYFLENVYPGYKTSCNLNNKDILFREAFISKDKKITYCFIY